MTTNVHLLLSGATPWQGCVESWISGATPWHGCAASMGILGFSEQFWQSNTWQLAGWTMIHFTWIGTAILALVFLTRLTLRRAHPTWRYATTLVLFTALALSPLAIAGYLAAIWPEPPTPLAIAPPSTAEPIALHESTQVELSPAPSPTPDIIELTELDDTQLEALATPPENSPIIELTDHPEFTNSEPQPLPTEPKPELATLPQNPITSATEKTTTPNISPSSSAPSATSVVDPTRAEQFIATLDRASQYLPWLWLIGAPLTFALLATGLVGGERLRRSAELLTTGPIVEACEALKKQLKITRRVAIAVTDRVAQPVLVGIIRPMILLPWAALHGWRPDQIEMVLVHELAHVRRWDNLVNLGQRVVESLLFYHPAVWLVSRWLRHDREECCDAVVVAQTGEPAEYANLLITVASQLKPRRSLLAASAMAQHPLTRRIRRLLQLEDDPMLVSRTSVLMGIAVMVVAAVVAANYPLWAEDEERSGQQPQESVTEQSESNKGPVPAAEDPIEFAAGDAHYTLRQQEDGLVVLEKRVSANSAPEVGGPRIDIRGLAKTEFVNEVHRTIARQIKVTMTDGAVYQLPADGETEADSNSPFLSLEDQRVADLAYNMLGVEVEPLTEELPPEGRERGFKGGVKVVQFDPHNTRQERNLTFIHDDILVGLHVWPINDFDSLGEVLRRDDLEQFSPLKVYLLRPRKASRAARDAREVEGDNVPVEGYELITGRMSFSVEAWAQEQNRLGNNPGPTPGQLFRARNRASRQSTDRSPAMAQPNRNLSEENESKAGDLRDLRYDGRSFDEWRSQWRNELKVEQRIDAIKAMTAFGRAGYGREAAEAIFDVAAQYDFNSTDFNSPEWQLIQAVKNVFVPSAFVGSRGTVTSEGAISTEIWMNVLAERLESDRDTYLPIVVDLLPGVQLEESVVPLVERWSKSEDDKLRRRAFEVFFQSADSDKPYVDEAFRRALAHEDRHLTAMALHFMRQAPRSGHANMQVGEAREIVGRLYPEVVTTLFHSDEPMRKYARWLITHVDDELANRFAEDLVARLEATTGDTPEAVDTRIAAIRALGALGTRAGKPSRTLKDPKGLITDMQTRAALGFALLQMVSPETLLEEAESILNDLREGLDPEALQSMEAALIAEAREVYPKQMVPPSAAEAFIFFEAKQAEPAPQAAPM